MDSILDSIKQMLGIETDYEHFDMDIVMWINAAFSDLYDLGVGPDSPFSITGSTETWSAFSVDQNMAKVRTYVYLKTRIMFDPPSNSNVMEAMQKQIAEYEWRLNVDHDNLEEVSA